MSEQIIHTEQQHQDSLRQQRNNILKECALSLEVTGRVMFPDYFDATFSWLHKELIKAIESGHQRVVIAAPRGLGKTTISRCLAAQQILFKNVNFVPYVSYSAEVAELQTENLKRMLITSKFVGRHFGPIKVSQYKELGLDETFSKLSWVAYGNTLVLPRGAGQQIRGVVWGPHRPDLIIVDDLENKKEIANPNIRGDVKEWFHGDLMKAVSKYKHNWRVIYIDTVKHEDSLLEELLASPEWYSIRLQACNDKLESTAPEYMTNEQIQKEFDEHQKKGQLDVFFREYRNIPISTADAVFKQEYFKYYKETDADFRERKSKGYIESVILVDPAKSVKLHSAESAIVGVGVDVQNQHLYVRDIIADKFYPDELYNNVFDMAERLNARVIGLEVTSLNEFITFPFKNEMMKRGKSFELIELHARRGSAEYADKNRGKEGRIAALTTNYRMGEVFHNEEVCAPLEAQLLMFPRSKRWDVMDAFAYIIEILEKGLRYFLPKTMDEDYTIEDEYQELKSESFKEPELEDWRLQ